VPKGRTIVSRENRKALIGEIEALRGSRVLAYVTSDRPPVPGQISNDAVRPLYHHLRKIGLVEKLDLFLYSTGGAIDVPWRINTALRTNGNTWAALVPFRANSAATLLCLGADEIVLGHHGELGPIDPTMTFNRVVSAPGSGESTVVQDPVSVEDIMTYLKFIKEQAGLSDQAALATGVSKLTERMDAVSLGSVYRTFSHIRDVARRMLLSQSRPQNEQTISTIVETLAEKVHAHGHAIGIRAAEEIGLPAKKAEEKLDGLMWRLLEEYETDLKLREPLDPFVVVAQNDVYTEEAVIAVVEAFDAVYEFAGQIQIKAKRRMPPTLNVSMNLNMQMPAQVAAAMQAMGPAAQVMQQMLQQVMQQVQQIAMQQAQQAVQEALKQQAPFVGFDIGFRGGRWRLGE